MLWGSAGGQGDYPARVGLHPLYEPRGHDLAELRKVFYLDDLRTEWTDTMGGDLVSKAISETEARARA